MQVPTYQPLFHQASRRRDIFLKPAAKEAIIIIVSCCFLGLCYALLWDRHDTIVPLINGIIIGLACGMSVALGEYVLFKSIGRRLNFISIFFLKIVFYVCLLSFSIFSVILTSRSIEYKQDLITTFYGEPFQHLLYKEDFHIMVIYAIVMMAVIIFTKQMSRKMGQRVLFNYITGKYTRPYYEERIFMFIDLDSSSSLAETLGDLRYHQFLNEFYYDITDDIVDAHGEIYQYVGDEVVVTWKLERGLDSGNCILAYFKIVEKIEKVKEKYIARFGTYPRFKAAVHCGQVIAAQIGDIKSEIVFHGDVVNTTSRIERLCSDLGERFLISKDLLVQLPEWFVEHFVSVGNVKPRGKQRLVGLFGFREKASKTDVVVQSSASCL
ncbi:MAG TPA: adenylate/guanylate cyclase domain-containing protein [Chryseolinea sp.]